MAAITAKTPPPPPPLGAEAENKSLRSSSQREDADADADTGQVAVQYRVYKRRWLGLAVLMALNIVISWGWLTFAPVADLTQEWFGLPSQTPVNWLSTVILFSYAAAAPAVVYTLSNFGIKPSILSSALLVLCGNWVRYAGTRTRRFSVVMFGQILIGFAQPFVLSAPTYYSDLWFTSEGRVTATALASLSNPVGAALGQLVNPVLCPTAAQMPSMVLYVAIISTACCLPWLVVPTRPPTPPGASSHTPKMPLKKSLRTLAGSREFWLVFVLFTAYIGFFNTLSSLLNQIMLPYSYSADEAGITGALLIVVGLVASAVVSPVVDRTHSFLATIRTCVPVIGACYVAFIFAPTAAPGRLAPPFVVASVLGASSFALLPLALEYVTEQTWPAGPEVASGILWASGNVCGGVFLCVMDALRDDDASGGGPRGDMKSALIFQGVVAAAVVPCAFFLRKGGNKRMRADGAAREQSLREQAAAADGAAEERAAEEGAVAEETEVSPATGAGRETV